MDQLGVVQKLRGQDEEGSWSKKCLVLSLFRVKIVHVEEGEVKNGPKIVLIVIE